MLCIMHTFCDINIPVANRCAPVPVPKMNYAVICVGVRHYGCLYYGCLCVCTEHTPACSHVNVKAIQV